jgi:hypothetical protein
MATLEPLQLLPSCRRTTISARVQEQGKTDQAIAVF